MKQDRTTSDVPDAAPSTFDRLRRFAAAHRAIIIVVAVAFVLRLIWLLYAQPVPISDFNDYRNVAAGIIDHRQFGYPRPTTFYLPVHPLTLAAFMLVSRADLWLGFGMVLVSTATCLLVYLVGRRVFDRETPALIAAAIFAVLPTFVFYSPVLASEHMFIALMLAAILVTLSLGSSTGRRAGAAGALIGLAVLTRGEAMPYAAAFVLFLWLAPGIALRVRLRQVLLFGVGMVAVLTPWYVRNSLVADPDVGLSSGSGINFYFAHNDSGNYGWHLNDPFVGMTPEDANREGWRLGLEYLRENPLGIFKDVWRGTRRLFAIPDYAIHHSTQEFRPPNPEYVAKELRFREPFNAALRLGAMMHLSAAALALLLVRRWARPLATLLMPLIVLSWVWRTVLFWGAPRYGYFIVVMLAFFAALTVDTLIRAGRRAPPAG